jgi:lambda family phage tail tape measure protein
MANTIARLGVRLGLDTAEFVKGIEAAKKDLSEFASQAKTMATVGVTAFAAMTYKALEFADSVADVATANELAIDTVLKLGEALAQNGGKAENASKMLSSFTAFVDKAASGSFEAQKSFKDLDISLKDLGSMSMEQLLEKVFRGLEKMPDTITRNARAMEMFGKGVKGVAIGDLAKQMQEAGHITEVQAQSVKDAGDAWDKLHKITHALMVEFTAFIGTPALQFVNWLEGIAKKAENASDAFTNLGRNMKMLAQFASAFGFAGLGADEEKLKKFAEEYRKLQKQQELGKFDQGNYEGWMPMDRPKGDGRNVKEGRDAEAEKLARQRLAEIRYINNLQIQEGKQLFANLKLEVDAFTAISLRQKEYERVLQDQQEEFKLSIRARHMRQEDVLLEKELLQIESNRKKMVDEISRSGVLDLETKNQAIEREEKLAQLAERNARARQEITKAQRGGSFGEGFGMAMEDYFRNMATELERGQQAFESVMGNMNAALDNFVRTGKLSFKDLARSIIQDLMAIQLKAQAAMVFKSMGGMGLFSSLFGGSSSASSISSAAPGMGYADGGEPPVGVASLVGERGPELFVPKTAGTVIPNNMLGSTMGNKPSVVNNYNIQAIDTKSFEDRIMSSPNAIWAANQYANKSLAVSRGRT